jgi:hypothetical protein
VVTARNPVPVPRNPHDSPANTIVLTERLELPQNIDQANEVIDLIDEIDEVKNQRAEFSQNPLLAQLAGKKLGELTCEEFDRLLEDAVSRALGRFFPNN